MKPVTHTSSLMSSVGSPWEIYRIKTSRGVVDVYTKSGGIGVYVSLLVLVPDYNFGWVVLSAADSPGTAGGGLDVLTSSIADAFLPAMEAAAKDEAATVFAGTYKATNGVNSSITIATDGYPGLGVQRWISNGYNIFESYVSAFGLTSANNLTIRLYPTNLLKTSPRQQAFRSMIEILPTTVAQKSFFPACGSWGGVDAPMYGSVGLDEFLFHFDEYGRVVSVEPRAFRVTMQKDL
jgi:hypothetical protein